MLYSYDQSDIMLILTIKLMIFNKYLMMILGQQETSNNLIDQFFISDIKIKLNFI